MKGQTMTPQAEEKNIESVIRTTVAIDKDDYRIAKIAAAYEGQSVSEFMATAIAEKAKDVLKKRGAPS